MPPRRSHHKSRNGCLTCKRRRVKCDETGPPCQNCKSRGTECDYAGCHALEDKLSADSKPSITHVRNISPSERRTIELQLLHRWSTITYRSCSSKISDDYDVWQMKVPEVALERGNEFLFDTLLSLTAFELAYSTNEEHRDWSSLGLEYQLLAFHGFRDSLQNSSNVPSDNHEALLFCSILLFVLALATATNRRSFDDDTVIDHIVAVHELVRGAGLLITQRPEDIDTHPLWRKIPKLLDLVQLDLDAETTSVLRQLEEMNESRRNAEEEVTPVYKGCDYAIKSLRFLFKTCCSDNDLRSYTLAWLSMAGPDYMQAVKDSDPVALLSLVCWGVMLEPFQPQYWYINGFGRRVIYEVSEMLGDESTAFPGHEVTLWAMRQLESGKTDRQSPQDSAIDGCESSFASVSIG